MIKSMTGYGRAQKVIHGLDISVEIRSVNNRYLDCSVKIPRLYLFAEDPVKQYIKEHVNRGKTDVFITIGDSEDSEVTVSLNRSLLESYLKAMRSAVTEYGILDDISTSLIARLPDVFVMDKSQTDEDQIVADILSVLSEAMEHYNEMRTAEGLAMERDLRNRADTILQAVSKIEARSPETVREYRERLTAKIQEVLADAGVDENRMLTEAAIYADRVAVDEETVRLRSHFSQMDKFLRDGGAVGRKLDFLMQEMNREANTIGSKCSDVTMAQTVVDIKAELEKMREQIQNIE